jgi:hypothetical protein
MRRPGAASSPASSACSAADQRRVRSFLCSGNPCDGSGAAARSLQVPPCTHFVKGELQ